MVPKRYDGSDEPEKCSSDNRNENRVVIQHLVDTKFREFSKKISCEEIKPETNYFVWLQYRNSGQHRIYPSQSSTPIVFDSSIEATQKAWMLTEKEAIDQTGVISITSFSQIEELHEITELFKKGGE